MEFDVAPAKDVIEGTRREIAVFKANSKPVRGSSRPVVLHLHVKLDVSPALVLAEPQISRLFGTLGLKRYAVIAVLFTW